MVNYLYIGIFLMFIGLVLIFHLYIKIKINQFMEQLIMNFEALISPKKRPFRQTSKDAEESIKETKEAHYKKLLEALANMPNGATSEELSKEAKLSYESTHKRLFELVRDKKAYNTGETRYNSSHRKAMVRKINLNHEK